RRYIKAADADAVWKRNRGGGCEYVDAVSGRRCGSAHQLQRDHVQAYSRGGSNEAANLQILCAKHNRFLWRKASVVRCAVYDYVG
ncbi:MAG: HNH endonuclease, partial [Proteobacteria bacterium]